MIRCRFARLVTVHRLHYWSSGPARNSTFRLIRCYSSQPEKKEGFFGKFVDNFRQEINKNKEMKDSLKKFREEAEKLEHSDALKKARQKYQTVESEASKSSEVLKEQLGSIKNRMQDVLGEAAKSDFAKKAGKITEEFSKVAQDAAGTISEGGAKIGQTSAFRSISETAEKVQKEIDENAFGGRLYKAPKTLRKRVEVIENFREIIPDENANDVVLHKDSKFSQSWEAFKDNNPYVNKVLNWKMKYDESDHTMIRATRFLTDKVTDIFGGLFQKTEMSEVLTEIVKMDPEFDKTEFLKFCEVDIIPNILEAMVRGNLEILEDWFHKVPFTAIATPIKTAKSLGLTFHSKVLDVHNVDLIMGKIMENGPVLIISFQAQQIMCLRDRDGNVKDGDPDKVLRVDYVWALCRDPTELNPKSAWRVLDISAQSREQLL